MTLKKQWIAALASGVLSFAAVAAPIELAGVKFDDPLALQGARLQLNGAGIRYKAIFKVYAVALYLDKKAATAEEALAAPGPKRINLTLLRDIDANELGKIFTKAFEDNAPKSDMSRLVPGLIRQGEIFAAQKKMLAGESIFIDWLPGTGTVISVRGKQQGEAVKEPEFYTAMMRIWLGPKPADWKLKDELLGKTS